MDRKNALRVIFILLSCSHHASSNELFTIYSPDATIAVVVHVGEKISYVVEVDHQRVIGSAGIDLVWNQSLRLSDDLHILSTQRDTVFQQVHVPLAYRTKNIVDHYHQITIQFNQPFDLQLRVYNSGFAYRLVTRFKDSIRIHNELASTTFIPGSTLIGPMVQPRAVEDKFHTSFEEPYQTIRLDSLGGEDLFFSPIVIDAGTVKIAMTESDVDDYPGMFITSDGKDGLKGIFAPYPAEEKLTSADFAQRIVTRRENFIAQTKGERTLPWRVFMIARADKELPANDMVYLLAAPSHMKEVSWIQPGSCTDEWIIDINLFNVPFKAGINTLTYKYYIDFARRFGFDRIMLDAGWSAPNDLFKIHPEINMDEIVRYAKAKGIKLNLWTLAATLDRQLDSAMVQFKKWGIDFIMTDFIDRDDQVAIRYYKRITEVCAQHKIMIMFHGASPPKGFNRTHPNNITREAVLGSEYNAWSDKATPEHNVTIPFTRMLAGPLDYEPGILDNATHTQFKPIWGKVMSQGTRSHQLAMFVVYDSPLQIFSGNPAQGWMEPAFMDLMGSLPSAWDTTIILDAKMSDYIITARRSGKDWYIGGMTDWTERSLSAPLSFLESGTYQATSCVDGINAGRYASDYTIRTSVVTSKNKLLIHMAPGGGTLIRLKRL